MKKIPLYLFITVFIYFITFISDQLLVKYLAYSYTVYFITAGLVMLCIYFVINIYRQSCFTFNKIVFITTVITLFSLTTSSLIDSTYNTEKIFKTQFLTLNDKLPMMIDKNTRFDKVYFKDDNIYYQYTLININSKYANKDFITLSLTDKIYQNSQIDKIILKLSKKKRSINYIYQDKNQNILTKVELKNN